MPQKRFLVPLRCKKPETNNRAKITFLLSQMSLLNNEPILLLEKNASISSR